MTLRRASQEEVDNPDQSSGCEIDDFDKNDGYSLDIQLQNNRNILEDSVSKLVNDRDY